MLSKVLAHEVNFGFHNMGCMVLASFNGDDDAARSLGALASAIARSDAPVLEFALQRNLTDSRGHELQLPSEMGLARHTDQAAM